MTGTHHGCHQFATNPEQAGRKILVGGDRVRRSGAIGSGDRERRWADSGRTVGGAIGENTDEMTFQPRYDLDLT